MENSHPLDPLDPVRETLFTYVLRSYDKISDQRVYSPYHHFGGFLWRMLIFPKGNLSTDHDLSVYLECGGPSYHPTVSPEPTLPPLPPEHWICPARFSIILHHPNSPHAQAVLPAHSRPTKFYPILKQPCITPIPCPERPSYSQEESELSSEDGDQTSEQWNPPLFKRASHDFKPDELDWGFLEFAAFDTLQPGKYADKHMNVVISMRITLDDLSSDDVV
ncbi:hypothetical protein BWQ96_01415 [Gracilariopsis chorda]|uniref:MATH domain-containing protein n=1 Tax=Gracilariopsis chorda TaxID=448386 RepID=A0A2V3J3A8_9FLOR|nr:hypothetical protein BWQ96_01415 [Gracilariopsis chorda]|eukprot:PXF48859.1 hypothetical protein BWQ96_01415 [Gracilariopsis chorda]